MGTVLSYYQTTSSLPHKSRQRQEWLSRPSLSVIQRRGFLRSDICLLLRTSISPTIKLRIVASSNKRLMLRGSRRVLAPTMRHSDLTNTLSNFRVRSGFCWGDTKDRIITGAASSSKRLRQESREELLISTWNRESSLGYLTIYQSISFRRAYMLLRSGKLNIWLRATNKPVKLIAYILLDSRC